MFSVAGFAVFFNTVYILFMSTDIQPWNDAEAYADGQFYTQITWFVMRNKRTFLGSHTIQT